MGAWVAAGLFLATACGEMVDVPAGPFWMGTDPGEAKTAPDEQPRHRVTLDPYRLDTYEVTQSCFARFVASGGYAERAVWSDAGWDWRTGAGATSPAFWGDRAFENPAHPVVGISWFEADAYCRWRGARLPTEAEWEKGARGDDGRRYPWGATWSADLANGAVAMGRITPVGGYPGGASPYGAHDMAGNVWEWVQDWYARDYYGGGPAANPPGPPAGGSHVLRGGAWNFPPFHLRAAARTHLPPGTRLRYLGFRCAR